jgi:hypothetical protein
MKYLALVVFASFAVACASGPKKGSAQDNAAASAQKPNTAQTAPSQVDNVGTSGELELKCKRGNDERTMTIVPKAQGCQLFYQKFGKGQVVASSEVTQSYCENVRSKMKANLEKAGFKCR